MPHAHPQKARRAGNDFYRQLTQKAKPLKPLRTAVVMPVDVLSLEGAVKAAAAGLIIPILIGPGQHIRHIAQKHGVDITDLGTEDSPDEKSAARLAVELAAERKVDAIMKGHLPTHILLHEVVSERALHTNRKMSHIFVVRGKDYPKPLFITDAALNIDPDLIIKRDIVQNAIDLFHCLEIGKPKVAILSATEEMTSDLPDSIEAAALSKMADRGVITGGIVDGPLAFDNAISKEAAKIKNIRSPVAGDADILIMPDLQAGNLLYKQMRYLSGYEDAGIVVGARIPIIVTSRAADIPARVASAALAVLACHHKTEKVYGFKQTLSVKENAA